MKCLRHYKVDHTYVDNIPCKVIYRKMVFSWWKANIECWLFLPPFCSFVSINLNIMKTG